MCPRFVRCASPLPGGRLRHARLAEPVELACRWKATIPSAPVGDGSVLPGATSAAIRAALSV